MPGEDLLLDARNLMSILGLYCDLLASPGVLQPEHRKYADDLRLVGTRSEALIGRLMEQLTSAPAAERRRHADAIRVSPSSCDPLRRTGG